MNDFDNHAHKIKYVQDGVNTFFSISLVYTMFGAIEYISQ